MKFNSTPLNFIEEEKFEFVGQWKKTNSLLLHWFHSTPWNQLKKRSLSLWSSKPAKQANQLSSSLSFFDWKEERVMGACFVVAAGPPSLKIKDFQITAALSSFHLLHSISANTGRAAVPVNNHQTPISPLGRADWCVWLVCWMGGGNKINFTSFHSLSPFHSKSSFHLFN